MNSLVVHYKNKYPGAEVRSSESGLDVYMDGKHMVALRKNGAGQFVCRSEELGCEHKHSLAPIPKDARLYKEIDGKISKDEKFEERKAGSAHFKGEFGYVPSCKNLKEKFGYKIDANHEVIEAPSKEAKKIAE